MADYDNALRLSELKKAAKQCAKGRTRKASVSGYLIDSLCKNHRLKDEIVKGRYKISKYMEFKITEPKVRDICATKFRDRVWQKSMCNNGLRGQLLRPLIYDNGACQKDKGVDFAVDRLIAFLQKYFREHHSNEGEYDHLDVRGFFPNTPHSETKRVDKEYVRDAMLRRHVCVIIDSFEDKREAEEILADEFGKRGTALGSEISQLLQLAAPNHVDHAVKERLRFGIFIRFNDDMILVSNSREELEHAREFITTEYAKMGLEVTVKQKNSKLSKGIKFLKRRIILTDTGKVIVKPDPSKFGKERRTLRKLKKKLDNDETTMKKIADQYQSARAGLARCDAKVKVKSLNSFYTELFGEEPPTPKRRRKNAYNKSKAGNRASRGRHRKAESRKQTAEGNY